MEEGQNWVDESVCLLAVSKRVDHLCESIMEFISIEHKRCQRGVG